MTGPYTTGPPQAQRYRDLHDALDRIDLDAEEQATLGWLAGWPAHTTERITRMIRRSRLPAVWSEQNVQDVVTNVLRSLLEAGHDSLADGGGRDDVRTALAEAGIEPGAVR